MKRAIIQHLVVFALGIIAGISLFNLFSGDSTIVSPVQVEDPAVVAARIEANEAQYQGKVDSLAALNVSLQVKVSSTQTALKHAKRKQQALEQTVLELTAVQEATTDSITLLENCDSLAVAALDLLDHHRATDSLHSTIIGDMQVQLNNKDSIIQVQRIQYDTLKVVLDNTLLQQQVLIQANETCYQRLKKQKRGKKLMAALLFIGAGITAGGVIR